MKCRRHSITVIVLILLVFSVMNTHAYLARYAGYNNHGQGGLGDTDKRIRFEPLRWSSLLSPMIRDVAVGQNHMVILFSLGQVMTCGDNTYGQLGIGSSYTSRVLPTLVPNINNVIKVACGNNHTLLLTDEGTVYAFGRNHYGQLGVGDTTDRFTPTNTWAFFIEDIACGGDFSAILHQSGDIRVCGDNYYGQLAQDNTTPRDEWVYWTGTSTFLGMDCGQDHMMGYTAAGILACGGNYYGQLGVGDTTDRHSAVGVSGVDRPVKLALGDYHSVVLKANGDVCACGNNASGQLGLTGGNRTTMTTVSFLSDYSGIGDICAGGWQSFFFTMDGRMLACGQNTVGQLGLGPDYTNSTSRSTPTIVPGVFGPIVASASANNSVVLTMPTRAVPNDYDGDGISDLAIFAESTRRIYTDGSTEGYEDHGPMAGVYPKCCVSGDYDGDGIMDRTFFQPSSGYWLQLLSGGGFGSYWFGWEAVQPVPGDYDGDGIYDITVYYPGDGDGVNWYIQESSGGVLVTYDFGWNGAESVGGGQ